MNLINDPWLMFRYRDGRTEQLPMVALCDPDIVDFVLPREDFQGAAYQFAIGLLQTVFAPANKRQWHQFYRQPPTAEQLQVHFNKVTHAFNVGGDGPQFMQDFDSLQEQSITEISALLIEAPGANGIKQNTDHFIKRGLCEVMSLEMASLALFTLQINAPSGGAGHRVGLRGGGPLTTLVMSADESDSLWHKLWLNVINQTLWQYPEPDFNDGSVFPWLAPTKTSEKKGSEVYQKQVHPLQMFWAMPRRIRLALPDKAEMAECQLTGLSTTDPVRGFRAQNYGANYAGDWSHPLTPYKWNPKKSDAERLSMKGQPGGITYRHWDGFNFSSEQAGQACARVVGHYGRICEDFADYTSERPHIWAFGYDMDNMKARGWYSTHLPLFSVGPEQQEQMLKLMNELQELSVDALWQLRNAIKQAWYKSPGEVKGDFSFIDLAFWQQTESAFSRVLQQIFQTSLTDEPSLSPEQAKQWLDQLRHRVLDLFDEYALREISEQSMSQRIKARQQLSAWLYRGKKMNVFMKAHHINQLKEVS